MLTLIGKSKNRGYGRIGIIFANVMKKSIGFGGIGMIFANVMKKNPIVDHLYTYDPINLPCLSSVYNIYDLTFHLEIMIYLLSDLLCVTVMTLYHNFPLRATICRYRIDLFFLQIVSKHAGIILLLEKGAIYLHRTTWFYQYSTRMMSKKTPKISSNSHWNPNSTRFDDFTTDVNICTHCTDQYMLKWKCCHFGKIFVAGCTESCHFDNFWDIHRWKFSTIHQNILSNFMFSFLLSVDHKKHH